MCKPELIEKIDNGEAVVISKVKVYITIFLILAGVIVAFTTTKLQAINNEKRICVIEQKLSKMDKVDFNVKNICKRLGVDYIE